MIRDEDLNRPEAVPGTSNVKKSIERILHLSGISPASEAARIIFESASIGANGDFIIPRARWEKVLEALPSALRTHVSVGFEGLEAPQKVASPNRHERRRYAALSRRKQR